jgi:type III restriction enzyme
MDSHGIPGVNRLGTHGRWAFGEFGDVCEMQEDFAQRVREALEKMLGSAINQG